MLQTQMKYYKMKKEKVLKGDRSECKFRNYKRHKRNRYR